MYPCVCTTTHVCTHKEHKSRHVSTDWHAQTYTCLHMCTRHAHICTHNVCAREGTGTHSLCVARACTRGDEGTYVDARAHVRAPLCVRARARRHVGTRWHVRAHMCTHTRMQTRVCTRTDTCVDTRAHSHAHAHLCTCPRASTRPRAFLLHPAACFRSAQFPGSSHRPLPVPKATPTRCPPTRCLGVSVLSQQLERPPGGRLHHGLAGARRLTDTRLQCAAAGPR